MLLQSEIGYKKISLQGIRLNRLCREASAWQVATLQKAVLTYHFEMIYIPSTGFGSKYLFLCFSVVFISFFFFPHYINTHNNPFVVDSSFTGKKNPTWVSLISVHLKIQRC